MADTVSFYFFSRGVKRSVHRPVKNREERITLENGLNGAQRLNGWNNWNGLIPRSEVFLLFIVLEQADLWSLEDFHRFVTMNLY
jgi:hypothetical protein